MKRRFLAKCPDDSLSLDASLCFPFPCPVVDPHFEEIKCMDWIMKSKTGTTHALVKKRRLKLNQLTNYCRVQCAPFLPKKGNEFKCSNCRCKCTEENWAMHSSTPACPTCITGALEINQRLEKYARDLLTACLKKAPVEPAELPSIMRVRRKSRHGTINHPDCFVCDIFKACREAHRFRDQKKLEEFLARHPPVSVSTAEEPPPELVALLRSPKLLTVKRGPFRPPKGPVVLRYAACVRAHLSNVCRLVLRRVRGPNRPSLRGMESVSIQSMLECALKSFRRLLDQIVKEGKCLTFDVRCPFRELLRPGGSEKNLADRLLLRWIEKKGWGVRLTHAADKFSRVDLQSGLPAEDAPEPNLAGPGRQYIVDTLKIQKHLDDLPSYVLLRTSRRCIGFYPTFFSCIYQRKSNNGVDISKNSSNVALLNFLVKTIGQLEDFLVPGYCSLLMGFSASQVPKK